MTKKAKPSGSQRRGASASLAGSAWCSEGIKLLRPHFGGFIWYGGGMKTCSRRATRMIDGRAYCTYHANRRTTPNGGTQPPAEQRK